MTEQISLAGKVAVVTGAGRGLGRAYVELLAERGAIRSSPKHAPWHEVAKAAEGESHETGWGAGSVDASAVGSRHVADEQRSGMRQCWRQSRKDRCKRNRDNRAHHRRTGHGLPLER